MYKRRIAWSFKLSSFFLFIRRFGMLVRSFAGGSCYIASTRFDLRDTYNSIDLNREGIISKLFNASVSGRSSALPMHPYLDGGIRERIADASCLSVWISRWC
jgi:hypothetical protein